MYMHLYMFRGHGHAEDYPHMHEAQKAAPRVQQDEAAAPRVQHDGDKNATAAALKMPPTANSDEGVGVEGGGDVGGEGGKRKHEWEEGGAGEKRANTKDLETQNMQVCVCVCVWVGGWVGGCVGVSSYGVLAQEVLCGCVDVDSCLWIPTCWGTHTYPHQAHTYLLIPTPTHLHNTPTHLHNTPTLGHTYLPISTPTHPHQHTHTNTPTQHCLGKGTCVCSVCLRRGVRVRVLVHMHTYVVMFVS